MSKAAKPVAPQKVEYNDAVAESKKYFEGDDLAATVWVSKYALKDSFGNIYETSPKQMHERIAAEIERIERKYPDPMSKEEVFELLDHFRYVIPQGGPMTGIGNNFQVASLSNCFVIGHKNPADSYGGIFRMDEEQVQLMKRRGGVGHDLSHIRPTGSPVLNSALTSTGIVPFMERYSNSTREVAQDGRRGALMLSLSIKHPDAERFIDAKVDTGKVTAPTSRSRSTTNSCAPRSRARSTTSSSRSSRTIPNTSRTSTPRNSGIKSSTTHGSRPSRACCSGIRSSARACPTAMPTRAS